MDLNTGKYGSSQSTTVRYIPFTGKYQDESWTFKMTIPYLEITGPQNLINVLNGVAPTGPAAASMPVTRSGLGDVVLTATHHTYSNVQSGFFARLTGKAKLGTASRAKGLGTEENDFAFQSDLYQMSGRVTLFGTLGFKAYGNPTGAAYKLNNGFFGSIGGVNRLTLNADAGATLNLGEKTLETGSHRAEAVIFGSYRIEKNWKVRGYVLRGLTESVPAWGTGAAIGYTF